MKKVKKMKIVDKDVKDEKLSAQDNHVFKSIKYRVKYVIDYDSFTDVNNEDIVKMIERINNEVRKGVERIGFSNSHKGILKRLSECGEITTGFEDVPYVIDLYKNAAFLEQGFIEDDLNCALYRSLEHKVSSFNRICLLPIELGCHYSLRTISLDGNRYIEHLLAHYVVTGRVLDNILEKGNEVARNLIKFLIRPLIAEELNSKRLKMPWGCPGIMESVLDGKEVVKIIEKKEPIKSDGFIYIIKQERNNFYKIGKSKNPESRLKALQTANPSKLVLVYKNEVKNMTTIERKCHKLLSGRKKEGEWFELINDDIETVKSLPISETHR